MWHYFYYYYFYYSMVPWTGNWLGLWASINWDDKVYGKEADADIDRIACTTMVLQGLGIERTVQEVTKQCGLTSVWTIDLAYLLRNYGPDFTYYTSYFGSRKEYQGSKFYKATFDEDERRVNKLFVAAKSRSVHVVRM